MKEQENLTQHHKKNITIGTTKCDRTDGVVRTELEHNYKECKAKGNLKAREVEFIKMNQMFVLDKKNKYEN